MKNKWKPPARYNCLISPILSATVYIDLSWRLMNNADYSDSSSAASTTSRLQILDRQDPRFFGPSAWGIGGYMNGRWRDLWHFALGGTLWFTLFCKTNIYYIHMSAEFFVAYFCLTIKKHFDRCTSSVYCLEMIGNVQSVGHHTPTSWPHKPCGTRIDKDLWGTVPSMSWMIEIRSWIYVSRVFG